MTTIDEIDVTDASVWQRGVPHEWFDLLRREDPEQMRMVIIGMDPPDLKAGLASARRR